MADSASEATFSMGASTPVMSPFKSRQAVRELAQAEQKASPRVMPPPGAGPMQHQRSEKNLWPVTAVRSPGAEHRYVPVEAHSVSPMRSPRMKIRTGPLPATARPAGLTVPGSIEGALQAVCQQTLLQQQVTQQQLQQQQLQLQIQQQLTQQQLQAQQQQLQQQQLQLQQQQLALAAETQLQRPNSKGPVRTLVLAPREPPAANTGGSSTPKSGGGGGIALGVRRAASVGSGSTRTLSTSSRAVPEATLLASTSSVGYSGFSEPERMPEISEERKGSPEAAAAAGFPRTGRPMAVKFACACSDVPEAILVDRFLGVPITSDWEQKHLLQVSEVRTGVHRDAQKLYHAGREIGPGTTLRGAMGLSEEQMPARIAVHVLVDRESFPQRLGPFSVTEVPLLPGDMLLPRSVAGGFHWTMRAEALERQGIRCEDETVTAQCSPTAPLPWSDEELAATGVPPSATEFAWSYPVVRWEQVEQDPHVLEDWATMQPGESPLKDFLVVGGFVYLDHAQNVVHVTTPRENRCLAAVPGGLQFGRPLKWQPTWTKALLGDGRFQRVTIGPLRNAGVRYFCWLRPGERFVGEDMRTLPCQPDVPHGGFAYLFHELASPSPLECAVDCYFPLLSMRGAGTVPGTRPDRGEPFAIVGQDATTPGDLVGHPSAQLHLHSMSDSV